MLFVQILIILLATKLAGELSMKLGQPAVLGKLVIGIIIGPAVLGWIEDSEMIGQISEIGVILLMFIAGLETDIKSLTQNRNSSFAVAIGGIILPFLGGYLAGLGIGLSQAHAFFLGLLLSATSVSISAQTLKELRQLKSREGTTILGAAVLDDILIMISVAVAMSLFTTEEISLGMVLFKKVIFFVSVGLIGWKFVPWIMKRFSSLRVSESTISTALVICFFFAYLAEFLGIAAIIGAFAAGVAISQTPYKRSVEQKIEPIAYAFFVPVFFVSVGLSVSFTGIGSQLWLIIGLTILAILTKLLGAGLGARITGFNNRSSLGIGAGMVSRGEVALILATIGLESQLLQQEYFAAIITVVILTTLITPPLLKKAFSNNQKQTVEGHRVKHE